MAKIYLLLAAVSGLLAVVIGAFGAHGLKGSVSAQSLATFQTGVQYQFFHTLALLAVTLFMVQMDSASRWLSATASCWLLGMLLFSGSLYWLALGGPRWLGPVTPLGGLLLMAGWLCLALGAIRLRL